MTMRSTKTDSMTAATPARLRVLIIDDDASCATGLAEAVEDLGAEAQICLRGTDAMAAAYDFRPEMVLLDLDMPGLSGFDIASAMRTQPSLNATKLIAVSGHNDADTRRGSAKAGFDLHLAKPVKLALLEDILDLITAMIRTTAPQPAPA